MMAENMPKKRKRRYNEDVRIFVKTPDGVREVTLIENRPDAKARHKAYLTEDGAKYIRNLLAQGCIISDILDEIGITRDTLNAPHNRELFNNALTEGRARFRSSLRAKQTEVALNGCSSMLIFLGKNYLDQSDRVEQSDPDIPSPLTEFAKALASYRDDCNDD